jgi:glycosyltransferase involved in cell wall biosynthesis
MNGVICDPPHLKEQSPLVSRRTDLRVSVIICTYRQERWKSLVAAVESIQRGSLQPQEIIVVSDTNPSLLAHVQSDLLGVIALGNQGAPGLGDTRNSGVAAASGEIIAFLDDDALAEPDWLAWLVDGYRSPDVAGVGGAILPLWEQGRPAWFPQEFDWVVGCTYTGMPEQPSRVRNLIGCNMSYRREVFGWIGDFHLGPVCDETEFCIRLLKRFPEKILLYQPAAQVHHRVPESRSTWKYFRQRCLFEGGSKALVTYLHGTQKGLASERAYTFKILPRGVLRGLADGVREPGLAGAARAGAIVAGLLFTTAGYLAGKRDLEAAARARGYSGLVNKY